MCAAAMKRDELGYRQLKGAMTAGQFSLIECGYILNLFHKKNVFNDVILFWVVCDIFVC